MITPNTTISSPVKGENYRIKFRPSDQERIKRIIELSEANGQRPSATVVIRHGLEALERQLLGLPLLDAKDVLTSLEAAARSR